MTSYEDSNREFERRIDSLQEKQKGSGIVTVPNPVQLGSSFTRTIGFDTAPSSSAIPISVPPRSKTPSQSPANEAVGLLSGSAPLGSSNKSASPDSDNNKSAVAKPKQNQKQNQQNQKQGQPNQQNQQNQQNQKQKQKQEKPAKEGESAKGSSRPSSANQQNQQNQKQSQKQNQSKPSAPAQFDIKRGKAEKNRVLDLKPSQKQVQLFSHLPQYERGTLKLKTSFSASEIHPAIVELGLKYAEGVITGSNARCVALIEAFQKVIKDFKAPTGVFWKEFELYSRPQVQFLVDSRPLAISMGNAINYMKLAVNATKNLAGDQEAKSYVVEKLDRFLQERIVIADDIIVGYACEKIYDGDVILTYGRSYVVEQVFLKAHELGKKFRVVIVDSRPKNEGKTLLHNLVQHGVKCSYVTINAISYVIKDMSKVFVGAYTMMANGNLVSRSGTGLVAMMAHSHHIPFIVCCETYKFTERVQLESFSFNELGDPEEIVKTDKYKSGILENWKNDPHLTVLNLMYDLTPSEFIVMIITEVGMIPATSIPAVLREYRLAL
eukprot:TRINITY_DN2590_c0_g1_i1.p1 TRINITY_DN2590_c0_g1~~TRINITY_DN2590_c0_g1_i1.p1  ORF type:complete len:550 (-),score=149.05 TRINITY_DN2590_c0_g1_i1:47-1696(-)